MSLVRKQFQEIFAKKAYIKIILTARALGKSFNKAIDLLDKVTTDKQYTAVWLRRRFGDILASVAPFWKSFINWYVKNKNEQEGTNLKVSDFEVIGRGVEYKKKRQIFFYELYKPERVRGAFSTNIQEIIFDEAIPENGVFLEQEEQLFAEFLNSVYRDDQQEPPVCYFLANPYSKTAWFLKKVGGDLEELMSEQEKIWEQNEVLFYNSGNKDPRELMNKFESKYDERSGYFPKSADKWILKALPKHYKERFLMKERCILASFRAKYQKKEKFFFRWKLKGEKVDAKLPHICFENEEMSNSEQEIKIKGEKNYWRNTLLNMLVFDKLYFAGEDAGDAKSAILNFLYENEKQRTYSF